MSVSQRALREELGAGLFTRERIIPIALGLVALLLVFLIVHDILVPPSSGAAAVQFVSVQRGSVMSAVTGTGTVTPMTQQNVNFGTGGQVSEIDVQVGQKVTKGQTLAKLDPTQLQQALDQANNGLTSAQASLNNTVNGNSVTVAQHNLANAQQSLADTQAQVNLTNQQDQSTLSSDQAALSTDQTNANDLAAAQAALKACQGTVTPPPACPVETARVTKDTQAQTAVAQDQNKITQDNNKIAADQLSGQRSLDQANNSIVSAQDNLNSATTQRPNTIAQQQSSVSDAQISVATAQRNLNFATLTAPFDGTILAINNQVGDTVSGSGGSSSSSASSSGAGGAGAGGAGAGGGGAGGGAAGGGGAGGGGSSTSSSGTGFLVLGDLSQFQIVTPFAEADAARVQANQQATITFDAINGLTLPAHVSSIAETATVTSNVTNYNATLVLDQIDSRLKSGMTANANVIIQQAQNVLTLPNSVITHIGNAAFVTLLGSNGKTQTRQAVQTGAVGDTSTEITGGLNLGDRVVRPSLRTGSTTAGGLGARGGGVFGGGGGGVRIGGGGGG